MDEDWMTPGWEYRLYESALSKMENDEEFPSLGFFEAIRNHYMIEVVNFEETDAPQKWWRLATKMELSAALRQTFDHFQSRPKNEDVWIQFLCRHLCFQEGRVRDFSCSSVLCPKISLSPLKLSDETRVWVDEQGHYLIREPLQALALKLAVNHIVVTFNSLPSVAQIIREIERAMVVMEISVEVDHQNQIAKAEYLAKREEERRAKGLPVDAESQGS